MQTSVLESLDGTLCEHVTGRADSGELLETIHRSNLFVIALDRRSGGTATTTCSQRSCAPD